MIKSWAKIIHHFDLSIFSSQETWSDKGLLKPFIQLKSPWEKTMIAEIKMIFLVEMKMKLKMEMKTKKK